MYIHISIYPYIHISYIHTYIGEDEPYLLPYIRQRGDFYIYKPDLGWYVKDIYPRLGKLISARL
jgi:hypothetical protein